jgi:hypothetical protein
MNPTTIQRLTDNELWAAQEECYDAATTDEFMPQAEQDRLLAIVELLNAELVRRDLLG